MYDPVFLFVQVVSIDDFLFDLFVHFGEVDKKAEHYRKILVFEGVDGLADAVFVAHEVAFFEVYLFLDDALQRVQHLLLYL